MSNHLDDQDWQIRFNLYRFFVEHGHPPAYTKLATEMGLSPDTLRRAYHRLHRDHAIFLETGTDEVRMANPLSAVSTPYQVEVNGRTFYANCAWDSLGIPAMLAADAHIKAEINGCDEPVRYAVERGELHADERLVVHFPLPFRNWYDDHVHT